MKLLLRIGLIISGTYIYMSLSAQDRQYELNSGWYCKKINEVTASAENLSKPTYALDSWLPAKIPGTVLAMLLNNQLIPDPFYGMNNETIPDIYEKGRDEYTYWFVTNFTTEKLNSGEQLWLKLRGVNYSCEVYLNGIKLNKKRHYGMFLRQEYNISDILAQDGNNRLAVLVFPPDPVGNPNGGQGGDGTIARNATHQYVAGWDWIQPIRDRNTGIWDKVILEKTGYVKLRNAHIKTFVEGERDPGENQEPARITSTIEVENTSAEKINGRLLLTIDGQSVQREIILLPGSSQIIELPELTLKNPRLWWPSGYGNQNLYRASIKLLDKKGNIIGEEAQTIGIREIQTEWNTTTQSLQVGVNGKKIFIKGGNWIISDALLRLSADRYDSEVRFHRDMNLNLIRIWGGALIERPEFYDACDKYGMLVFQDFGFSGDCNGKWLDPMKKEDQWIRRKYPDDHQLVLVSIADQVKMIRNHPSLGFWCGGNEITPPGDILRALSDSILPGLDGTRIFIPYSNSSVMSYNTIGGNGDGPYTIQSTNTFWEDKTFPFNSEIGSVGTGDYESLKRFIPEGNMIVPDYKNNIIDSVWEYHKDIGYGQYINAYGKPADVRDFAEKAQFVNYDQYKALAEGFSAHMWQWYTGYMIWKTQNPWTALRGQMYDYYLDPNACLFGLKNGAEPIHVMCNPVNGMIMAVNNTFETQRDLMLGASLIGIDGEVKPVTSLLVEIGACQTQKYFSIKNPLSAWVAKKGGFLALKLSDMQGKIVSENFYWYPDSTGVYSGLQTMPASQLKIEAHKTAPGTIEVVLQNPSGSPVAFFNRVSLIDSGSGERLLPVFYSDNYVSILPGETRKVLVDCAKINSVGDYLISVRGWNLIEQKIKISHQ